MLLIGNGRLITHHAEAPYLEDGGVAVEDGVIADLGPTAELRARYPDGEWYNAAGRVVMPGLINAHTHIHSAFARGLSLPQARPNRNFMEILENIWWRIDKVLNLDDTRMSAYATGLESVRCGVTTLFDHHASQNHVAGSLFAIADALQDIGLRSALCYEVSDRDGAETAARAIRENTAFIEHAAKDKTDMRKGMLGLHASFTLSDKTLEDCVAAMGGKNVGYHVHVAEGIDDLRDALKKYGKRVVERLYDAGILGEKTLAVHNVHINAAEMELLKATDTVVVHNPESNMSNAVGAAPVLQMAEKGVLVGLGTDAYTQDMLESLKAASLLPKHHLCDPGVGFLESMDFLFRNNAAICARHFKRPLGVNKKGAYADLIVVDYTPPHPHDGAESGGPHPVWADGPERGLHHDRRQVHHEGAGHANRGRGADFGPKPGAGRRFLEARNGLTGSAAVREGAKI